MHEESRRLLANPLQHRLERFALLRLQLRNYFPPGYRSRLQGKPQRADRRGVGFDYPQVCRFEHEHRFARCIEDEAIAGFDLAARRFTSRSVEAMPRPVSQW